MLQMSCLNSCLVILKICYLNERRSVVPSEYKLKLTEEIKKHTPSAKIYLYGSRATNTHRPTSDIDLAIDTGEKINKGIMDTINKGILELQLSLEVEVVDMNNVTQGHIERIEREKILW